MFFGRKPNVNKVRIFGYVVYEHIPKQFRELDLRYDTLMIIKLDTLETLLLMRHRSGET